MISGISVHCAEMKGCETAVYSETIRAVSFSTAGRSLIFFCSVEKAESKCNYPLTNEINTVLELITLLVLHEE